MKVEGCSGFIEAYRGSQVDLWPRGGGPYMFWGMRGKRCELHDVVPVAVEMEGFVLQEIQRLKQGHSFLHTFLK